MDHVPSAREQDRQSARPGRRFPDRTGPFRGTSRRELSRLDARADAWLLTDALASLSTFGLPEPAAERGRFAVVSLRNRAVLEMFTSEEEARRALAAVTPRRTAIAGRFAVVDARPADWVDEPRELPSAQPVA